MNNTTGLHQAVINTTQTEVYEIVLQTVLLLIVLTVAVFGNGFVCMCILNEKRLQVATNYFIFSLSSADFFYALICLPLRIYHVLRKYKWDLGLRVCQIWVWFDFFFCSASIANLAAISVDRYLKISSPLSYDSTMTKARVTRMLLLLWSYSVVLASFSPIEWSKLPQDQARGTLVENGACFNDSRIYLTIISVIGFVAPLSIMLLMYCVVFKVAVSQASKLARQHESIYCKGRKRRKSPSQAISLFLEVKATKTLIVLLSAFCVCWCPFFVLIFVGLHSPEHFMSLSPRGRKFLLVLFVYIFPNCNAALDPIIYTTQNQQFRRVIKKIMTRYRTKSNRFVSGSWFSEVNYKTRKASGRGIQGALI